MTLGGGGSFRLVHPQVFAQPTPGSRPRGAPGYGLGVTTERATLPQGLVTQGTLNRGDRSLSGYPISGQTLLHFVSETKRSVSPPPPPPRQASEGCSRKEWLKPGECQALNRLSLGQDPQRVL